MMAIVVLDSEYVVYCSSHFQHVHVMPFQSVANRVGVFVVDQERERERDNNNKVDHFRSRVHEYVGWQCIYVYDLKNKN